MNQNKILRRATHLYKSGCLVVGLEHFLVMFPSAMLIARLANTPWGAVIELPAILFACGLGTLLFTLLTKKQIPFFLGPSFSYIGFVSYQIATISGSNDIESVRATVFFGYIIAGIFLLLLSWIYRYEKTKRFIDTIFPSTIMGPAISLIGLELANMAAQDSGFTGGNWQVQTLAIVTLGCIIVFSLLRHHFLQNASILIGVLVGCVVATAMKQVTWPSFQGFNSNIPTLYFRNFSHLPNQWITLSLAVFPCSMIAFVESLGRLAVYEGMLKRDEKLVDERLSNRAITIHSGTSLLTSALCMMPSAIYAENLAIMNLHSADLSTKHAINEEDDPFIVKCYSTYSIYPYIIASLISIMVALIGGLQDLFLAIPMPILGGMELFVFGLISAPGIQMLVDQQVNYKKISNQIITASVFLAGISDISITYESLTLQGMSLGLSIGVIVNLITLILGHFGYLNEAFALNELLDESSYSLGEKIRITVYGESFPVFTKEITSADFKKYIRRKNISNLLKEATKVELQDSISKKTITFSQENGRIELRVQINPKYKSRLQNDHPRVTAIWGMNRIVTIVVDEYISKRLLKEILASTI